MDFQTKQDMQYSNYCFVYGCFSTAKRNDTLGFYKFPEKGDRYIITVNKYGLRRTVDRRLLWIEALNIGKGASFAIDSIRVCSLHFAKDDFFRDKASGLKFLKSTAVPRRNLPTRWSSPLTTKFNVRTFHRLKYRGYFSIHNPDGRKLTRPRRFLGEIKVDNNIPKPSYTKTVWVVRKPQALQGKQDLGSTSQENGAENSESKEEWNCGNVVDTYSLADKGKSFCEEKKENLVEIDDNSTHIIDDSDEQCMVVGSAISAEQWCTSELIIKEEPVSDNDQDDVWDAEEIVCEPETAESSALIRGSSHESWSEDDVERKSKLSTNQLPEKKLTSDEVNEDGDKHDDEEEGEEGEEEEEEEDEQEEEEEEDSNSIEGPHINKEEEEENLKRNDGEIDYSDEREDIYGGSMMEGPCKVCGEESCQGHPSSRPRENFFVCLVCSEIFTSKKQLSLHAKIHQEMSEEEVQLAQQRVKELTCEICGRLLSTKATLREHIMIHTGEKPHECLLCGKSFRHKANLVVHVNAHTIVNLFECKVCLKSFSKKSDLEKHLRTHQNVEFVCRICNAIFKSKRTLYNHTQLHSKKGLVRRKRRSTKARGKAHMCKICEKVLSTKATLREHMMIHSGEKPHVCLLCGKTVRHKANFVVHVQSHSMGKSYECDLCEDAFLKKVDLRQHKKIMHSGGGGGNYVCAYCSLGFKSLLKYNQHMETHGTVDEMSEAEEDYVFQPHLLEGFLTET